MELFAKAHQAEASRRTDVMLDLSTTHKKRRCGLKPQRHSLEKKGKLPALPNNLPMKTLFERKVIS